MRTCERCGEIICSHNQYELERKEVCVECFYKQVKAWDTKFKKEEENESNNRNSK